MTKMKQKIAYRIRYYLRRLARAIGVCHKCGTRLNYTITGRGICPNGCNYG